MTDKIKIGIVGAGIQGVCNALFLQKKGFQVTLFDREEPGSQAASYGNAGHFSSYAFEFKRAFGTKVELCSKNDSLVFKIYKKLLQKKHDAYRKVHASNFRLGFASI